jgi:hypothetical protein
VHSLNEVKNIGERSLPHAKKGDVPIQTWGRISLSEVKKIGERSLPYAK